MTFFVDSNVLLYAVDRDSPDKRVIAHDILVRGRLLDLVLCSQVLGEFLNVVRRKQPARLTAAIDLVEQWALLVPVASTDPHHIIAGGQLAVRHRLQFWDSVLLATALDRGATILLTEDLQDGWTMEGLTVLNPFAPLNRPALDRLLDRGEITPSPGTA